jgi:poly(A) polymerase
VRRLLRDTGDRLENLIELTKADKAAANPEMPTVDLDQLRAHIDRVKEQLAGRAIESPLDGREIMELTGVAPGPRIGAIKAYLECQIIEGRLLPGDKSAASELMLRKYGRTSEEIDRGGKA